MVAPKLRFQEFDDAWNKKRLDSFLERISNPVDVVADQQYTQIGIRSHGKGIFHKGSIDGKELGNKRVFWIEPNTLVVNIVFAWERAIAVTSDSEKGMIASHRFPMYLPKKNLSNVNFLRYFFVTNKGQKYLELASPGGAGRNKTLGQSNFAELKIDLPSLKEQTKIANFLSAVDEKISQFNQKHELLSQYKQGMMQKLFSQQIRFKADDGSEFGEWQENQLLDLSTKKSSKVTAKDIEDNDGDYIVFGASGHFRNINSYTESEPYIAIVKDGAGAGRLFLMPEKSSVLGTLEIVKPNLNIQLNFLFYRMQLIDFSSYIKGSTIPHVYFKDYSQEKIYLPCLEEQTKIANFLSAIDQKIEVVAQQIEQAKTWKKGLLQQMFI